MTRILLRRGAVRPRRIAKFFAVVLAFAMPLAGCSSGEPDGPPIVVGGKTETDSRILLEFVAGALEDAGMKVERRYDLGGSKECDELIRAGKIDVYPEYGGTALWTILRSPMTATLAQQHPNTILDRVRADYAARGLEWSVWLGFENPFVLVARAGTAAGTISEMIVPAANWRAGFDADFQTRPDGFSAVKKAYNLAFAEVKTLPKESLYKSLADHAIDVTVGYANDGAIAKNAFRIVEDNKQVFIRNPAAVVVRKAALQQFPGILEAIRGYDVAIDTATMKRMNEAVDTGGRTPSEVARELLDSF